MFTMIAHTNRAAWEIINNGTAQVKTQVHQEPSEAAAGEDSGSCAGAGRTSGLRIVRALQDKKTVNLQERKAVGRGWGVVMAQTSLQPLLRCIIEGQK